MVDVTIDTKQIDVTVDEITYDINLSVLGSITGNLDGLSDVTISSPSNSEGLIYNSTTSRWENGVLAGSGNVSKVGTPVDNQVGVWTGNGTIEGDSNLTFTGEDLTVSGDVNCNTLTIADDSSAYDEADESIIGGLVAFDRTEIETNDNLRPIAWDFDNDIKPTAEVTILTDYHGINIETQVANGNIGTNKVGIYPFESTARHGWNTGKLLKAVGGYFQVSNQGNGDINTGIGIQTRLQHYGTGTVDNMYNHYIYDGNIIGAGDITNQYGIYSENLNAATNNWFLYSNGGQNYLQGKTGIGTTTPQKRLDVYDDSDAQAIFHGYWDGGANDNHGKLIVGKLDALRGEFQYDATTGNLYIDNTYDNANNKIVLRTRTAGTPISTLTAKDTGVDIIGDISVTGTVDGIDIATDVAANTLKVGVTDETSWSDAIDSSMTVDTDSSYNIGTASHKHINIYADNFYAEKFGHVDDADTYIDYSAADKIDFIAGAVEFLTIHNTTQDIIVVNEDGADVDFRVEGDTISDLILVDASADTVATKNHSLYREETAGESLVTGNLCYLKSDGKYWKADSSAEATASTDLLMCIDTIAADAAGTFLEYGEYVTTGLTAGSKYYISETAAAITATAPTTSAAIVRIVGTALSTTVLKFKPDTTFVELS